jgi:cell division protein FtsX
VQHTLVITVFVLLGVFCIAFSLVCRVIAARRISRHKRAIEAYLRRPLHLS